MVILCVSILYGIFRAPFCYNSPMKTVQLTNNPPVPKFKGISVAILPGQSLQLKFYQVTREDEETIYAEVTSAIQMDKEQWESLKQIVDGELEDSVQTSN